MKEPNTIWKCAECGIVFEALNPCEKGDDCIPACCGRGLTRMMENHSDGAGEKHVPVAAPHNGQLKVTVPTAPTVRVSSLPPMDISSPIIMWYRMPNALP